MATPYIEELALTSKNNEGIGETISLTEEINGVEVPLNLTGRTFFAQARKTKSPDAELICEITVNIVGDPTDGMISLTVDDDVMKDINPVKGHYDVLTKSGPTGLIDNLYMAPFIVEGGVSKWLT